MTLSALALGTLALASACSSGAPSDPVETETAQALCSNKGGVNAVMTALAVAAGMEMNRWLPSRDFQWNSSTGMLETSNYGRARCADKYCANVQALLSLQQSAANGKVQFAGNIKLDVSALKSALKSAWNAQAACDANGSCPYPVHDLDYTNTESGSCDEKYFFDVHKQASSSPVPDPSQLANALVWAGYPDNRMLNFYVRNGQVSIDPTAGLNEGNVQTSGSCSAVCTKVSLTDATGQCCVCNGSTKTLQKSTFSTLFYLCQ